MHTIRRAPPFAAVLVLAAFTLGERETPLEAVSISTPVVNVAAGPCALVCWMGFGGSCPTDHHLAVTTEVESARNVEWGTGPHNDYQCYPQSCEVKHGFDCDMIEGLEELRASLAAGDAEGTSILIRQSNARVVINRERSAVQALSCTGEVVAHLPVAARFADRVQGMLH